MPSKATITRRLKSWQKRAKLWASYEETWKSRHEYRRKLLTEHRAKLDRAEHRLHVAERDGNEKGARYWTSRVQQERGLVIKWEALVEEASDGLKLNRGRLRQSARWIKHLSTKLRNLGGPKPKIVDAGLDGDRRFGFLGPEVYVTGHYTAGPVDRDLQHALALCRQYNAYHASQGWGGIGYHYCIARDGTLILLRSTLNKGAHVGGSNTGNVGVMCHGTTGDKPSRAQAKTFRWLRANAHTGKLPKAHRTDRDLRKAKLMGHNSWAAHLSNGCPGSFKTMYLSGGKRR